MFCPKCAAHNLEDAKFCRACGTDISLVPQVLTGHLAERLSRSEDDEVVSSSSRRGRRRREKEKEKDKSPATIEKGVQTIFGGVGFVLVSLAIVRFMPGGFAWGFWMLIPAFFMLGEGIATIMRARREQQQLTPPSFVPPMQAMPPPSRPSALSPLRTGELLDAPPSITEGTTRHLGVPVERTPKDVEG